MRRWLTVIGGVGFLLAAAGGCGTARPTSDAVLLTELPPEIMKRAAEKLPGVAFDAAFRKPNGTIELRGKTRNGKVREVLILPDGTIADAE